MTNQAHDFTLVDDGAPQVRVEELAPTARFLLRVRNAHFAQLSTALALALPKQVGEIAQAGNRAALCLGPDEWLLTAPEGEARYISDAAAGVYAAAPHALVEISDREITLRVHGPAARELLAMNCSRDLDRLAPGRATRTLFDTAQVVLWRDRSDDFRLDVWRSFAPHVRALLQTGETELAAGL